MVKHIQATPIQEKTWILSDQVQRLGILSEHTQGYSFLGKRASGTYAQITELEQVLGMHIQFKQLMASSESAPGMNITQVHNLPIKHDAAHNVQHEPHVTYTKTPTSAVRFSAGYWMIKFATGWMGSLSPKTQTLQEHEHVGPFSTKLEMNTMLSQKNAKPSNATLNTGTNT